MEQENETPAAPETTESEVVDEAEQLKAELANAQNEVESLREHVKAVSAEFENFRRRQQEEQKRRHVLMKEELFRELLPLVDNLDRSLESAKQSQQFDALVKGVELIRRGFDRLFESHEVQPIPTEGVAFDPALHEAMMVEERDDVPDQSIVQELQRGYKLGDRVLRASMVKVARNTSTVK